MWLYVVTLVAVIASARARESLVAEFRQRLVDIFGEQVVGPDEEEKPILPGSDGNATDCKCLPYSRCRVTNESFYWSDKLKARHLSCPNVFDWCCEPLRQRSWRPARAGCGWGVSTAPGSHVAGAEEFPWVVAILDKTAGKTWTPNQLIGTGSIIHPSAVLTAAHKVYGVDHAKASTPYPLLKFLREEGRKEASLRESTIMTVSGLQGFRRRLWTAKIHEALLQAKCRAGEWNASSVAERLPHQDRSVSDFIIHEGYYRPQMANNFALVILATPFDLFHFPHVGTACLVDEMPPPGTICYGTGWGKLEFGDQGKYSQVLKKVALPLVEQAACERELRGSRLGAGFTLHGSLACAGGAGADTCTGDGGAPLVCPIGPTGQRVALAGLAAWGVGCGGRPAAYARVPPARAWAARALRRYGIAADFRYDDGAKGL